jgi:UDP-glucose 4-epimerase
MKIAITGAAGFIGGQIMLDMRAQGHEVLAIDPRPLPPQLQGHANRVVQRRAADQGTFASLIQFEPDAIVHCGGTSLVGPSMTNPSEYYHNNVIETINMLDFLVQKRMQPRIMFSSSASVYGRSVKWACKEDTMLLPVSPYGESKFMVEKVLASYRRAYDLDYVSFRFFNACGADPQGRHGQEPGATHIIARVLESVRHNQQFVCNGNDYETADGTCIRDYVHVADISLAHQLALNSAVPAGAYNLGTEQGHSNLEVLDRARLVTQSAIPVTFGPRRAGDPDSLTADSTLFKTTAGWQPQYNLEDMVRHAWNWYNRI